MRHLFNRIIQRRPIKHVTMSRIAPLIQALPDWEIKDRTFRVRLGTEADVETFVALEEDAYKGFQAWKLRDFETDIRINPYCVYLLVEDIQTLESVAMISGRFLARGAHISHLVVRQAFQGMSIGNRLLTLWLELVKSEKIPEVTLEVRASNFIAQKLYIKEGFVKVKEIPHYYSDNFETAYLLRHRIGVD